MFLSLRDLTLLTEAVSLLIESRRARKDILLGRVEYQNEVSSIKADIVVLERVLTDMRDTLENTTGVPT